MIPIMQIEMSCGHGVEYEGLDVSEAVLQFRINSRHAKTFPCPECKHRETIVTIRHNLLGQQR